MTDFKRERARGKETAPVWTEAVEGRVYSSFGGGLDGAGGVGTTIALGSNPDVSSGTGGCETGAIPIGSTLNFRVPEVPLLDG